MHKKLTLLFTLLVFFGCRKQTCEIAPEIAKIPVDITLDRLEKPFFAARQESDIRRFLQNNEKFAQKYLQLGENPGAGGAAGSLLRLATDPNLQKFAGEVEQKFGAMADMEQDLENGFRHLKHYYPQAPVPRVATFISGLMGPDMFVSDSLVVLGIDYFAGKSASYRPQHPQYILKRYEKPYMVPAVMLQLSSQYNRMDRQQKTMLAEMVDFGKAYYFTQRMLPCTPDSLIIGYTAQEIADIQYNEGKIWAHFIDKGLLYETNHFKVNKYTGERPNIPEISPRCPGRIATWIGWQIVRKYMAEHPEVTLQQLMQEQDAQKLFLASRYKPKRK